MRDLCELTGALLGLDLSPSLFVEMLHVICCGSHASVHGVVRFVRLHPSHVSQICTYDFAIMNELHRRLQVFLGLSISAELFRNTLALLESLHIHPPLVLAPAAAGHVPNENMPDFDNGIPPRAEDIPTESVDGDSDGNTQTGGDNSGNLVVDRSNDAGVPPRDRSRSRDGPSS